MHTNATNKVRSAFGCMSPTHEFCTRMLVFGLSGLRHIWVHWLFLPDESVERPKQRRWRNTVESTCTFKPSKTLCSICSSVRFIHFLGGAFVGVSPRPRSVDHVCQFLPRSQIFSKIIQQIHMIYIFMYIYIYDIYVSIKVHVWFASRIDCCS